MRIGVNARFLRAPVTGVQRFGHELVRELPAFADTVLLVPEGVAPPDGFRGDVVVGRVQGHAWEQVELPRDARRAGCDVVVHPANTLPLAAHRSVVVMHDPLVPLSNPEWFTRRYVAWQRLVIARAVARATRVLTVSEWSRQHLARVLNISEDRIGVTPQGLAPYENAATDDDVQRVRRRWSLPAHFLLAFGGRDPRKNLRFMLAVLDRLRRRGWDVDLVVVGDAIPRVHRPDSAITPRPNVRFLGHVDAVDTHALLTAADVLCFPSLCESFGRPPLEAMACGTPALVGAYDAAREVLGDDEWVLPWDVDVWTGAIQRLLQDPGARARALAKAAPLRTRYTWQAAAASVLEACERAMQQTVH